LADALENKAKYGLKDATEFNRVLDRAISEYQEGLKYNKDLFAAYLRLGDTYRMMGLYAQSEEAYIKGLEIEPGHYLAMSGLQKIRSINAQERDGSKRTKEILEHFKVSAKDDGEGGLMGFEDHTVVMDRLIFTNILFDEWSAELNRTEAIEQLAEIGKALVSQDLGECDFVVEGHTDNRGGLERNLKLSRDRSESVKAHLVQRFGIEIDRVQKQGFGYSRPRVPNDTTQNMLKNRRVEIVLVGKTRED
jgi:outer membrane protein OmpA-like peptidoglycan-associated protein